MIRKAKEKFKNKIETKFRGSGLLVARQGIKNIAAVNNGFWFRRSKVILEGFSAAALPNILNTFLTHF